jgi:hypothetical protein
MKFSCTSILWAILALSLRSFPADLEISKQVSDFLGANSGAAVPNAAAFSAAAATNATQSGVRPVVFRVHKDPFSRSRLNSVASSAGIGAFNGAPNGVSTQGDVSIIKNGPGTARAGYDAGKGSYFFFNYASEQNPLSKTDPASLEALKSKAQTVLKRALADQATDFEFANTESDWAMIKAGQEPVLVRQTLRYTKRVNGRHVLDNTAYFSATYSGNQELCRFEFVNPRLEPVPLDLMVKPSATMERLRTWASEKQNVESPKGETVGVRTITATKAMETYRASVEGGDTFLVPHVSFWSRFQLENGTSYERFIDLCQDATRTTNLDNSMIENSGR